MNACLNRRELDYRTESDNAKRFKELYSHMKEIYVPNMFDNLTSAQVGVLCLCVGACVWFVEKEKTLQSPCHFCVNQGHNASKQKTQHCKICFVCTLTFSGPHNGVD